MPQRQYLEDGVQQVIQATGILSGDREHLADSKTMKLVGEALLLLCVNFVDGEEERLAGADQLASQFNIRSRHFCATVHHHDDSTGFYQSDLRLAENFRGDEVLIFGENAPRINAAEVTPSPPRLAIETVARDARLVANNGATRAYQAIEERGFTDVGTPHDSDGVQAGSGRSRW